ncbi:hypothetical protein CISIN_1g027395mg [Citrus sinensis]|uniref:MADS-box domain-containing protein n=1 Tax=Citrus sinensis TaxID=2711 RepID=A0A067F8R4_CITSI|nr:hypothetical protein CISIN_1g027395mg [Citrus sinensis]
MGRRKLLMQKIDNYPALQVTYTKRRDGIVKKAKELSVLCDTDVGLLMFSPSGKLTKYSSSRRIEDIFLRFICDEKQEPLENEDHLYRSLVHSKCEGEMLDLIKKKEELEKKLIELCERQFDAEEKMSFYQPKVEDITTIHEAVDHEKFLNSAIRRVEKLNAKLLQKESASRIPESIELEAASFFDGNEVPVPPNSKKKGGIHQCVNITMHEQTHPPVSTQRINT